MDYGNGLKLQSAQILQIGPTPDIYFSQKVCCETQDSACYIKFLNNFFNLHTVKFTPFSVQVIIDYAPCPVSVLNNEDSTRTLPPKSPCSHGPCILGEATEENKVIPGDGWCYEDNKARKYKRNGMLAI